MYYGSLEYGPKLTDTFFGGLNTQIPSIQFFLQANSPQYDRFSFFINSSAGISWLLKDEFTYTDKVTQNRDLTGNYNTQMHLPWEDQAQLGLKAEVNVGVTIEMTQNISIIFKIGLEYERERDVADDITFNKIKQDDPLYKTLISGNTQDATTALNKLKITKTNLNKKSWGESLSSAITYSAGVKFSF